LSAYSYLENLQKKQQLTVNNNMLNS